MQEREVVIWHNPRCSKSRQGLAFLGEHGIEPRIVRYLEDPPDEAELERVLDLLGMKPRQLMRRKEKIYRQLGLDDENLSRNRLIRAMVENPKLIERPVVIAGDRAVLGRPPEAVLEIIAAEGAS